MRYHGNNWKWMKRVTAEYTDGHQQLWRVVVGGNNDDVYNDWQQQRRVRVCRCVCMCLCVCGRACMRVSNIRKEKLKRKHSFCRCNNFAQPLVYSWTLKTPDHDGKHLKTRPLLGQTDFVQITGILKRNEHPPNNQYINPAVTVSPLIAVQCNRRLFTCIIRERRQFAWRHLKWCWLQFTTIPTHGSRRSEKTRKKLKLGNKTPKTWGEQTCDSISPTSAGERKETMISYGFPLSNLRVVRVVFYT